MVLQAGILSDTHLHGNLDSFQALVDLCFADCPVIIHAGDLTSPEVLDCFGDRRVLAVHGNMCSTAVRSRLEQTLEFSLGAFCFGLTHGAGLGPDIESALLALFPQADCLIYGHTHRPVCHRIGKTLIINPGSFRSTSPWGAPGTYVTMSVGDTIEPVIREVPRL